jgi:hypothetical protein
MLVEVTQNRSGESRNFCGFFYYGEELEKRAAPENADFPRDIAGEKRTLATAGSQVVIFAFLAGACSMLPQKTSNGLAEQKASDARRAMVEQ